MTIQRIAGARAIGPVSIVSHGVRDSTTIQIRRWAPMNARSAVGSLSTHEFEAVRIGLDHPKIRIAAINTIKTNQSPGTVPVPQPDGERSRAPRNARCLGQHRRRSVNRSRLDRGANVTIGGMMAQGIPDESFSRTPTSGRPRAEAGGVHPLFTQGVPLRTIPDWAAHAVPGPATGPPDGWPNQFVQAQACGKEARHQLHSRSRRRWPGVSPRTDPRSVHVAGN